MPADATRIVVAQMARVYLASVGTAAPADPVGPMPTGWRDVGLFTPDSLSFATDPAFEEVRSHQSNFPTRRFQTQDAATAEVDLQEWSGANFKAVFGGGTITTVPANATATPPTVLHYRFVPPAIGARAAVAACLEVIDGSKNYRRIMPKAEQSEGVEQGFDKTSESTLPLRLTVIGADVGDPWYDLTNDPSFAATAG